MDSMDPKRHTCIQTGDCVFCKEGKSSDVPAGAYLTYGIKQNSNDLCYLLSESTADWRDGGVNSGVRNGEQVKMEVEVRTQDVGQAVHMKATRFVVEKSWITIVRPLPLLSSSFGKGNGTPLQYSCLENPMDGGAW